MTYRQMMLILAEEAGVLIKWYYPTFWIAHKINIKLRPMPTMQRDMIEFFAGRRIAKLAGFKMADDGIIETLHIKTPAPWLTKD